MISRRFRRLIRIRDAREVFDLTGQSFLVQALRVAPISTSMGALHVHFDEIGNPRTNPSAHLAIRRDGGCDRDHAVRESSSQTKPMRRMFSSRSSRLIPGLWKDASVRCRRRAAPPWRPPREPLREQGRNGAFAGAGQAGEPHRASFMHRYRYCLANDFAG